MKHTQILLIVGGVILLVYAVLVAIWYNRKTSNSQQELYGEYGEFQIQGLPRNDLEGPLIELYEESKEQLPFDFSNQQAEYQSKVLGFGMGPGLYGSGRHNSPSFGAGW